jgi:hypothetical protein
MQKIDSCGNGRKGKGIRYVITELLVVVKDQTEVKRMCKQSHCERFQLMHKVCPCAKSGAEVSYQTLRYSSFRRNIGWETECSMGILMV